MRINGYKTNVTFLTEMISWLGLPSNHGAIAVIKDFG